MTLRSRLSLLAVAALGLGSVGRAQDNLNELNGANSIENSKSSSNGNSGNVLDSEELNSSGGNSSDSNTAPAGNDLNSGNNLNGGNDLNGGNFANGENSLNGGNGGNGGNLNSNLNADSNLNGNTGGGNGNGEIKNPANGGGNTTNPGLNNPRLGNNPTVNPTLNGGNTTNPGNSGQNIPPPPNTATGPGDEDTPPPPQDPALDPNAVPADAAPEEPPAVEAPRKPTREELRQARLELVRKMAESIPALRPGEAPLEYTVQPGDTLWDISDQLLDDAMWWPRLWVLNPDVTNPDIIEPGLRLVFYPSTAASAPELLVQDAVDPFGPPRVDPVTLQTFRMDIKRWSGPTGEIIDASTLPPYQDVLVVGEPMLNASMLFRLPGFFSYSDVGDVGEIVSNENSPLLAGQGQNLIARFDDRIPNAGERFLVLREIPSLSGFASVRPDGVLYSHTGTVGVVRTAGSGYAVLVAEDGGSHISPSDILVPANKNLYVPVDLLSAGRPNSAPAFVVATESGTYQSAGPGIAVYLQGPDGRNPFSVGDDVELFMPMGSHTGFGSEIVGRERVAVTRIVDATPESAVGVIVKASREVTVGASTLPDMLD